MIRAFQTAADRAAFARLSAPWPTLGALLGRDVQLWAGNPGAPVKLFCLTGRDGAPAAALDVYGRTALLCGAPDAAQMEELAAFLHFAGVEKLRTPGPLCGWEEREALYNYGWADGRVLPLPDGTALDQAPPVEELAALLFPEAPERRDAYYVTACAARNHGLARQWLLRAADGRPLSTVGAGALYGGTAYLDMGYTVPAARRQGYFAPLITYVAHSLAGEGYRVTLDCAQGLCGLYERLGFSQIGIIRQYNTKCIK